MSFLWDFIDLSSVELFFTFDFPIESIDLIFELFDGDFFKFDVSFESFVSGNEFFVFVYEFIFFGFEFWQFFFQIGETLGISRFPFFKFIEKVLVSSDELLSVLFNLSESTFKVTEFEGILLLLLFLNSWSDVGFFIHVLNPESFFFVDGFFDIGVKDIIFVFCHSDLFFNVSQSGFPLPGNFFEFDFMFFIDSIFNFLIFIFKI